MRYIFFVEECVEGIRKNMAKLLIFSHGFPLQRADLKNDPRSHPDEVERFGFLVFTHSLDQIYFLFCLEC